MKFDSTDYERYRSFWQDKNSPDHSHNTEDWFSRYFREMMFLISSPSGSLVDAGCGNGEFLLRFAPYYSKMYGVDYSPGMAGEANARLRAAGVTHCEVFTDSILNIAKLLPTDAIQTIISNSVIQYLTLDQVHEFVAAASVVMKKGGELVIMNIPNVNHREQYKIRLYKREEAVPFRQQVAEVFSLEYSLLKQRLRKRNQRYDDGIGHWFSFKEIREVAQKSQMNIEFFYSVYPPYGYRFHAKLMK